MVDFVCVSTRSLKVKFKFEKVKICVVATYDPSEGNVEKRTIFWDNLNDVLDGGNRRFSSFATYLPIQGFFFFYSCHHHSRAEPYSRRGCGTLKSSPSSANYAYEHLSLIHISEPTRLLSISYAVFCLKKKKYK